MRINLYLPDEMEPKTHLLQKALRLRGTSLSAELQPAIQKLVEENQELMSKLPVEAQSGDTN